MTPTGRIHWTELMTHDAERAKAFYASTLGWTFEGMAMPDGGTYWIATSGEGRPEIGLFTMSDPHFAGMPEHWMPYFAVEDADQAGEEIEAAGGALKRPPFDVPGVGRIVVANDAGGALVGFIKPAPMPGG